MEHDAPQAIEVILQAMKQPSRSPLERGLAILELLTTRDSPTSLEDISALLEVNKSTAFRLLETLEQGGFVSRPMQGNGYLLGAKTAIVGDRFKKQVLASGIFESILQDLRNLTRETTGLFALEFPERACLLAINSEMELHRSLKVGSRAPLHSGAVGKVMLASLEARQFQIYLDQLTFPVYRGEGLLTREQLIDEVRRAREAGFSVSVAETVGEVWAIAVPISSSLLHGAIVVTGPSSRMPAHFQDMANQMRAAIEQKLNKYLGGNASAGSMLDIQTLKPSLSLPDSGSALDGEPRTR